jgi:hypothetical protein
MRWRLKPNHGNAVPGAIVCLDTESYEPKRGGEARVQIMPLRLGVARFLRLEKGRPGRREVFRFTEAAVFWEWLRRKMTGRRTTWLWCHNLNWDLCVSQFWRELDARRFLLTLPARDVVDRKGRVRHVQATPGYLMTNKHATGGRLWDARYFPLRMCDTFNWYRHSLQALGRQVGLPKMDFPGFAATDAELFPYCERDCEILERVVLDIIGFVREHDLGNLRMTPAAQALAAYRHHLGDTVIAFNPDEEVALFERRAYMGPKRCAFFRGRVCSPDHFELGAGDRRRQAPPTIFAGPVSQYDLTAAYASVMRGRQFPAIPRERETNLEPAYVLHRMRELACVAWVKVKTVDRAYPRQEGEATRWYCGEFQTALCGPELERAIRLGDVQHIYQAHWYSTAELFTDFVERMTTIESGYDRTLERWRRTLAKSIRNALHGKFGQFKCGWELLPEQVADKPWGLFLYRDPVTKDAVRARALAWAVQVKAQAGRVAWTFPAIAAYVVAFHRERMRQLVERAGPEGCLYVDADTLHVTAEGARRLRALGEVHSDEVGKLRLVKCCDDVEYIAPQHYRWGDRVINAGLPARAVPVGNGLFRVEEFLSLDQNLRAQPPEGGSLRSREVRAPSHALGAIPTASGWTRPLVYTPARKRAGCD